MNIKNEKVTKYLTPLLTEYIFDEFSDDYLEKADVKEIMHKIPAPIDKNDLKGLSIVKLAENMAFVLGCDPKFNYSDKYIEFIDKFFGKKFSEGLITKGIKLSLGEDLLKACVYFRAAIIIDNEKSDAYYFYGRALKDLYEKAEDEEFIGIFKAESIKAFETATLKENPNRDAFYYLGYSYVNMGLYVKAQVTWKEYIELASKDLESLGDEKSDEKDEIEDAYKEIADRLAQLEIPVKIENGYNMILAGRFQDGINILKPYTESEYNTWWPLWYYLATAYANLGLISEGEVGMVDEVVSAAYEEAIKCHLEVLKLSPSNQDSMEELCELYGKLGDTEKVAKYQKKLEIVNNNILQDKKEKEKNK